MTEVLLLFSVIYLLEDQWSMARQEGYAEGREGDMDIKLSHVIILTL